MRTKMNEKDHKFFYDFRCCCQATFMMAKTSFLCRVNLCQSKFFVDKGNVLKIWNVKFVQYFCGSRILLMGFLERIFLAMGMMTWRTHLRRTLQTALCLLFLMYRYHHRSSAIIIIIVVVVVLPTHLPCRAIK